MPLPNDVKDCRLEFLDERFRRRTGERWLAFRKHIHDRHGSHYPVNEALSQIPPGCWVYENKLVVICGPMFAGKTTAMIDILKSKSLVGGKSLAVKPSVDTRSGTAEVVTHDGVSMDAVVVHAMFPSDIQLWVKDDHSCVGIDEVQFFSRDVVDVCLGLIKDGKTVVVAGLDQDYAGSAFGPIAELMTVADVVIKRNSICSFCGDLATRTQRVVQGEGLVVIGGSESYEARCLVHWSPHSSPPAAECR